jgi:chaperonin cofactor prefoldin
LIPFSGLAQESEDRSLEDRIESLESEIRVVRQQNQDLKEVVESDVGAADG